MPFTFQSWFSITQLHVWMCQSKIRTVTQDSGKVLNKALMDNFSSDIELKLRLNNVSFTLSHHIFLYHV